MNFRVLVTGEAEKVLDRLDRSTEQRIRQRFLQLAVDPFDPGETPTWLNFGNMPRLAVRGPGRNNWNTLSLLL